MTMSIVRNLFSPAREPGLLLTCAVLRFGSGHNASDCAGKIHAYVAFDETGPIALAATPELDAITSVSVARPRRRRSGKHILENPNLERHLSCGTVRKGVRKMSLQRSDCTRGRVSRCSRTLRWLLNFPFDSYWRRRPVRCGLFALRVLVQLRLKRNELFESHGACLQSVARFYQSPSNVDVQRPWRFS